MCGGDSPDIKSDVAARTLVKKMVSAAVRTQRSKSSSGSLTPPKAAAPKKVAALAAADMSSAPTCVAKQGD